MKIEIDKNVTAEWWDDSGMAVVVSGPGFKSALDLGKRAFLDDVPDAIRARAAEIVASVVHARGS